MALIASAQITLSTISDGKDGEGSTISIIGGVRGVAYAADGSNPNPSTSTPFSVELVKNQKIVKPYSYEWSSGGNITGSSTSSTFTPKINTSFVSGNSYIILKLKETQSSPPITQTIPIVCTKYADGLDWINDWNGTGVMIGDKKIVTPRIFAGTNGGSSSTPSLTGVAIGLDVLGATDKTIGIVGYNKNDPRFKLDADGNFFVGSGWGDISSGVGGGFRYDAIKKIFTMSGRVNILGGTIGQTDIDKIVSDVDSTTTKVESWTSPNSTTINGGTITTGTVTATKLDVRGLTVKDASGKNTFSVAQNGDVSIDGILRSSNYSSLGGTGYQITPDGKAVLYEATIRGTVELPNAGITNSGEGDKEVRIWAGASYSNKEFAPFKVYQDGSLEAFNGTFNGQILGDYDNVKTHIRKDRIYISDEEIGFDYRNGSVLRKQSNLEPFVLLSVGQSSISTDLYFGNKEDRDFEYLKASKQIFTKTKNTQSTSNGSIVSNHNEGSKYHIMTTTGATGANHDIRYEDESDGMVFESRGTNTTANTDTTDFKFKKDRGEVNVSIEGKANIDSGVTSSKHNIEMRMTKTGFAFYLI